MRPRLPRGFVFASSARCAAARCLVRRPIAPAARASIGTELRARSTRPATTRYASSAASAQIALTRPSTSRYARPSGVAGTPSRGPAMSREQAVRGLVPGAALAAELAADGAGAIALGELGIGNTTSASALAAALLGVDPAEVCGRGTGLDDAGLARKVEVVRRVLAVNADLLDDPLDALAALGGFEIAFLAGVTIAAADRRQVVLLDGFITAIAALVAERLAAGRGALVAVARVARARPPARAGRARARAAARPPPAARRGQRRGARAADPPRGARDPRRDGDVRVAPG